MDLDDLDFLADYLKNRDKIVLSENEDDDMGSEKSKSQKKTDATKDAEDSNVSENYYRYVNCAKQAGLSIFVFFLI